MIINRVAEEVIQIPSAQKEVLFPVIQNEICRDCGKEICECEKLKKKSVDDIISYVRYVFDSVGTTEQKKVAETIISKFQIYATTKSAGDNK